MRADHNYEPLVGEEFVLDRDYNGDGKLDVAACNTDAGTVTVRLGDGSGGFGALFGSPVTVGSSPVSLAAADLDGDGAVDLVVSNTGSNDFHVLLGRGDGTFTPSGPYALVSSPNLITIGDFNGDRQPDVAANSGNTNQLPVRLQQCL